MKKTVKVIILVFYLIPISCNKDDVALSNLKKVDSIFFFNDKPYNGVALEKLPTHTNKYYLANGKIYFQKVFNIEDSSWSHSEVKNGFINGKDTTFWPDGRITISNYANNVPHGISKTYNSKGRLIIEKTFQHGRINGYYKSYINGKISQEGLLLDNMQDSIWIDWWESEPTYTIYDSGKKCFNLSEYIQLYDMYDSTFSISFIRKGQKTKYQIIMDSIFIDTAIKLPVLIPQ